MLSEDQKKWKLLMRSVKFFEAFSGEELDDFLAFCVLKRYEAHDYIIKEDNTENAFYVILRGQTSVIKGDAFKGKHQLAKLSAGHSFGEIAVVLNEPRSASVMAIGEVFLFRIDANQIKNLKVETREKLFRQFAVNLAIQLKMFSTKASI